MRLMETDVIKEFVEYAEEQGSKSPKKYYIHYSNLADKAVGITNREQATTNQLCELAMIENIIRNQLFTGMKMGLYYKDIFQNCKRQIELFKDIAYLNVG